jgi:carbon storage regulator
MLVLSRKVGEKIVVPACGLTITVVAVKGGRVRLGIVAPEDIRVDREEVWQRYQMEHADEHMEPAGSY